MPSQPGRQADKSSGLVHRRGHLTGGLAGHPGEQTLDGAGALRRQNG
ncbi:hypothetical protein [Micromonospora avicenniae]